MKYDLMGDYARHGAAAPIRYAAFWPVHASILLEVPDLLRYCIMKVLASYTHMWGDEAEHDHHKMQKELNTGLYVCVDAIPAETVKEMLTECTAIVPEWVGRAVATEERYRPPGIEQTQDELNRRVLRLLALALTNQNLLERAAAATPLHPVEA